MRYSLSTEHYLRWLVTSSGRLLEHPAVDYGTGESVRVESDGGLPVEVDGTPVETAPEGVLLSVVPGVVSVAHPDRST